MLSGLDACQAATAFLQIQQGNLRRFAGKVNEKVTGSVKLRLFKGSARVVGRESQFMLYDLNLSTYEKGSSFNQESAKGFIELWGLQSKLANIISRKAGGEKIG